MPDLDQTVLNTELRALAERYAQCAQALRGDELTSVVLFGSVARGEARPESDIDLLIICRSLPAGAFRRRAVLAPVRERLDPELERLWAQGCYTDFAEIIKTEAEAQHVAPFYLDLTEDGVLLFDRGGFFARILDRLRARLRELGAQRRRLGTLRYWDLKPDFKPGEVIEL
ncbi:MAG: nucleotidyltransferase domain-containing protein [Anaerolineae bacterium]|nr:nucleotidyltransferase domain-containing protein [Anaerolineae bacterium]